MFEHWIFEFLERKSNITYQTFKRSNVSGLLSGTKSSQQTGHGKMTNNQNEKKQKKITRKNDEKIK